MPIAWRFRQNWSLLFVVFSSTSRRCINYPSIFARGMATTTTTTRTKIAVAQLCSTDSKVQNLVTIARLARRASQEHCRFLFLPECFGFMGSNAGQTLQNAEDNDFHSNPPALTEALVDIVQNDLKGNDENENRNNELLSYPNSQISLYRAMETIAKTSKLWISAGGMHVKSSTSSVPDPSSDDSPNNDSSIPYKVYNTHFIWDDQGRSVAEYPKIHLFDVTLPTVDLRESKTTLPGTKLVVCRDTPIGCLGLSVCYDVRFPEQYIALRDLGAQVLLVPSAFTVPTGMAHWHVLLRARAIENQCFVIAAAQCGKHNEKRESYGHSIVIDPWGKVLADAGGVDDPSPSSSFSSGNIITCEIDLETVSSVRERMPIQQHREHAFMAASMDD